MMNAKETAIYRARNAIAHAHFIAASEVPEPHGQLMVEACKRAKELMEEAFTELCLPGVSVKDLPLLTEDPTGMA